jgi:hypothetical protein
MDKKTFTFAYCPACGSSLPKTFACDFDDDRDPQEPKPVFVFGCILDESLCDSCQVSLGVIDV